MYGQTGRQADTSRNIKGSFFYQRILNAIQNIQNSVNNKINSFGKRRVTTLRVNPQHRSVCGLATLEYTSIVEKPTRFFIRCTVFLMYLSIKIQLVRPQQLARRTNVRHIQFAPIYLGKSSSALALGRDLAIANFSIGIS